MASETQSPRRPALGATRARQGRSGRHVLWVLLFGTLLTVLGFIAALAWNADEVGNATVNDGKDNPAAVAFDAPPPQPATPQPAQTQSPGSAPPTTTAPTN
jgi:hypothetical protein